MNSGEVCAWEGVDMAARTLSENSIGPGMNVSFLAGMMCMLCIATLTEVLLSSETVLEEAELCRRRQNL